MADPTLSVIIVNWNTGPLLRDCLHSLERETSSLPYEVLVVDNASTDGSAALVEREFPRVRLLASDINRGFAGGNNLALPLAQGEYIALLNPDTVIQDRALERLVGFLQEHPAAGAVGPRLTEPDGRYRVLNGGWQPTIGTVFVHYTGLSRPWPDRMRGLHTMHNRRQRVGWLSGACLVVRREAAEAAGPLLEDWFLYAEDVEWCDRIGRGWELWYEPAAVVVHLDRQSTRQRERSFTTLWAHGLHHHYVRRVQAGRARALAFDLILAAGLLSRAAVYLARAPRSPGGPWRDEARAFARGAAELLSLGLARPRVAKQ